MKILFALAALLAGLNLAAGEKSSRMLLYIGTYTGGPSKGIYAFEFSPVGGSLKPLGLAAETPSPSFLAIHPGKKFLYAVNELGNYGGQRAGSISAFAISGSDGKLAKLNEVSSGGADPCHLSIDRTGRWLLAANYTGGSVSSVALGEDGRLGKTADFVQHRGSGVNKQRQTEPHAHSINLDPANRLALVADLGMDKIMVYQLDSSGGKLIPNDPPFGTAPAGGGPRHLSFHPDGHRFFANNEMLSSVTGYSYDPKTGAIAQGQTISTLPAGADGSGNSTAEIQVHPSGKFVYCSNRGHDSIAVFSLDSQGRLALIQNESTRGKTPRNFALDPSGNFLIAANQDSDTLAVFRIDPRTGRLEPVGGAVPAPKPVCLKFLVLD